MNWAIGREYTSELRMKTFKYSVHLPFKNYVLSENKSILSQVWFLEATR